MQTFSDNTGRKWTIKLPFGATVRVKEASEGKFDLLDSKELPTRLQDNLAEFWELLWHVIEPQAIDCGVTVEQFGEEMMPENLVAARTRFFDEWALFFRSLQREEVAIALEKMAAYTTEAVAMIKAKLSPEQLAVVDSKTIAKMQATLNDEFGKLLEKLE